MDERAARRANLELVKKDGPRTSSGLVPATNLAAATAASLGIATGVLLDGKYLIGRIVGAGAVGIVFEAKNVELDEKVAVKCLRPEMLIDPAVVARFAREAKAAAAIKSEYVATVHDVGTTDEGVPYIVMEYLEGKDLGTIVAESPAISARSAVEYALQVCEALAVAHAKGIVHRDIKPENLILTERAGGMRIVKVVDFGISKTALTGSIFQNELPLVKTVNLMGTPLYMSPEQVRASDSVDVRSDIWSLGMVIYEVLTAQTAFKGQSITEICAAILEAPPQPIDEHRADLPRGLVDVIERCLEKDAARRFQNIAELALALMPFGPKRTRLNVERAVAVLQASGHFDASVTVNSTMPPAMSDLALHPSIPRAPALPGIALENAPYDSNAPRISLVASEMRGVATSTTPTTYGTEHSTVSLPPKKKPRGRFFALAVAAVVGGGALFGTALVARQKARLPASSATSELPAANARTPLAASAEPLPTTTTEPSAGASGAGTASRAGSRSESAPTVAPDAPSPVAKAAQIAPHALGVAKPASAKPATSAAVAAPKPKPTSKPADEPDLGY